MPHVLLAKPACLIALVAISVMCSSGQGEAEEKVLIGVGSASCGKWTEAHCPSTECRLFHQWVLGYISGVNWRAPTADLLDATELDYAALMSWMDNYCQTHPLDPITKGANELVMVLETKAEKRSH
jgi:hypothetical protein